MTDTAELCGAKTTRGYNQTTASGRPFYVMDPRPEDVFIEDIAAHLSRICRFGGALKDGAERLYWDEDVPWSWLAKQDQHRVWVPLETYSVAQHSVLVSRNVPDEFALEGLLHDAAEAYVGDVIKPLKMALSLTDAQRASLRGIATGLGWPKRAADLLVSEMPDYSRIENRVDAAIRERFGLPSEMAACVKEADYRAVLTEHRDLQIHGYVDWGTPSHEPWPETVVPVLPSVARNMFMQRFNELYKGE